MLVMMLLAMMFSLMLDMGIINIISRIPECAICCMDITIVVLMAIILLPVLDGTVASKLVLRVVLGVGKTTGLVFNNGASV